ncbi:hypothetical protein WJX84_001411 [Apatococcus fuscideae]|uniref:DUF1279 domain-containing protein n=1 Tax=Apatococcus fuscideae TaxID=2026836 RepID=A0AAW1SXN3_9CHLO
MQSRTSASGTQVLPVSRFCCHCKFSHFQRPGWKTGRAQSRTQAPFRINALDEKTKEKVDETDAKTATEKYGLEAGLFKVFTSKDKNGKSRGQQAKELLSVYGGAYLITSISFAIVSFAICYGLVSRGVDVPALLDRFGLKVGNTGEKVGTVAIAYAAHKALSPVRFPPTVALTPVVARFIGKKAVNPEQAEKIDPNS